MITAHLIDHFFRHEYGKLVSLLSHRVGMRHIEAVEDAVQFALLTGIDTWVRKKRPDNPTAWLYRVAHNKLLSELRIQTRHNKILQVNTDEFTDLEEFDPKVSFSAEFEDEMLRMLFLCCDEAVPLESQLVFALKSLCGFSIKEISIRLFTSEANVYKRLSRARKTLKETVSTTTEISATQYTKRLAAVNKVLYLLFTEGYLSSSLASSIRRDLCEEAIRLTLMLVSNPIGRVPESFALLALMYFHLSRMSAREDDVGSLLLLEEQDRSLWDQCCIERGMSWLARSAEGALFSRYHAEAGVAAEHCLAPSFSQTRWYRVVECYTLLEQAAPSALHRLNRAVAIAEWKGPLAGLSVLKEVTPPTWLVSSYLWSAVLADLHLRCGNVELGECFSEKALSLAPTETIRTLLRRRFHRNRIKV